MPEELSTWHSTLGDELLQAEVHRANNLIYDVVLVVELEQKTVGGEGPLDRKPELLLDGTYVIFGGNSLGANLLAVEFGRYVCVDRAEGVHLWQLLRLDETDLQLFEFLLDLGGHKDDLIGLVGARLVVQLDLLVTRALDSDANHEVARDFGEVLSLGVEQGDPLVLDGVLLLEVDSGHIELVGADHLVSEDTFVHHLNGDRLHFNFARVLK